MNDHAVVVTVISARRAVGFGAFSAMNRESRSSVLRHEGQRND